MFTRIFSAFARIADAANSVADSLLGLAATLRDASAQLRGQLGVEVRAVEADPLPPPAANGRRKHSS